MYKYKDKYKKNLQRLYARPSITSWKLKVQLVSEIPTHEFLTQLKIVSFFSRTDWNLFKSLYLLYNHIFVIYQ